MGVVRVAVIGGGVVGLACAWELARGGADVTVLDAHRVGSGASAGNAGWVCPTISTPLPAPGIMREGLRHLLRPHGAFVLRPRLDATLARFLLRFAQSCTPSRFEEGTRALVELNRRTIELYREYRAAGLDVELHESGLVVAARTGHGLESYRELAALLRRLDYPGRIDELDADAVVQVEPALARSSLVGGLHAQSDAYVRPEQLTGELARSLRAAGADVREGFRVTSLRCARTGWLLAGPEELRADRVVVAASLGSVRLLRPFGVRLPLVAARGYSVTVRSDEPPTHALYLAEAKLALTPFVDGIRLAGVLELGVRGATVPPQTGARLVAAAAPYLTRTPRAPSAAWAGLRPVTADGLPLIGAVPHADGLFAATGHGMLGVTLAPATAAALAPLVLHGEAAPALEPFAPGRS